MVYKRQKLLKKMTYKPGIVVHASFNHSTLETDVVELYEFKARLV